MCCFSQLIIPLALLPVSQPVLKDHGSIIPTVKILWIAAKKHGIHRMDSTPVLLQVSLKRTAKQIKIVGQSIKIYDS